MDCHIRPLPYTGISRLQSRVKSEHSSMHDPSRHVLTSISGRIHITIIDKEGDEHTYEVAKSDNILDIAQENDLEMEGKMVFPRAEKSFLAMLKSAKRVMTIGACGGSCACSTCHVIVEDQTMYDKMPEPDDEENDMLDLAFGLTETSRLGCQVKMTPELDGLRVKLPSMTRNLQESDFSRKG